MTERERRDAFKACPILASYISTALQDLQYSESDEACTDDREARDTGTIFDCPAELFARMQHDCEAFMRDNAVHIDDALDLKPGSDGLRYGRDHITYERLGSTLWLARCGSGVTFTDDGDAECLRIMADYAQSHWIECLYFGDDGRVYHM